MANYLDLQTDVINLVNRSDCTTALAKTFLQQAQRKIQRNLRPQSLEKSFSSKTSSYYRYNYYCCLS